MKHEIEPTLLSHIAFVVRCAGSAAVAYLLANALGMDYPVWASMSTVIVAQERLSETSTAVLSRLAGTFSGIAVAVLVGTPLHAMGVNISIQIACGVGLCAMLVRHWSRLRVSMWTVPLVYLEATPNTSPLSLGVLRGSEVLLGGLVGVAFHLLAELAVRRILLASRHKEK